MALVKCIQISSLAQSSSGLIPQLDLGTGRHGTQGLSQTQAFPENFSALAQESMTPAAQRKALWILRIWFRVNKHYTHIHTKNP